MQNLWSFTIASMAGRSRCLAWELCSHASTWTKRGWELPSTGCLQLTSSWCSHWWWGSGRFSAEKQKDSGAPFVAPSGTYHTLLLWKSRGGKWIKIMVPGRLTECHFCKKTDHWSNRCPSKSSRTSQAPSVTATNFPNLKKNDVPAALAGTLK